MDNPGFLLLFDKIIWFFKNKCYLCANKMRQQLNLYTMETKTTTIPAVERTIIDCTNYKEAKSAAREFVFDHSGMIMELPGSNRFIILDAEYRTIADIHWNGFKNE